MRRIVVLLAAAAASVFAEGVSGTWAIEGDVVGNPVNETCTLKQETSKLSGSCKTPRGSFEIAGEVNGKNVTFRHGGEHDGNQLTITFSGTLDDQGVLKGSIHVDPYDAAGEFKAKKTE